MCAMQEDIKELRGEHSTLVNNLRIVVQNINELRADLLGVVTMCEKALEKQISRRSGKPTGHYQSIFGDYWHSFELFGEQLRLTQKQLSIPNKISGQLLKEPSSQSVNDWENAIDELEEALDNLNLRKRQRQYLLAMVELIDSTERLEKLDIPRCRRSKGKRFREKLKEVQKMIYLDIRKRLKTKLEVYKVVQIMLQTGEYPPPETTHIVTRLDDRTDDNIIMEEVVTKGYLWQGKLLRRSDVIVTSK